MHHVTDKDGLHRETLILGEGAVLCDCRLDTPINPPVYLSTAFCVDTLDELQELHKAQGYSYIRTRNPNRNMLSEMISYLEGGEQSLVFSSGMAAITTAISAHVKAGDHILADDTLYGETMQFIEDVMPSYGVEIGRAIILNPSFIVCDEPVSALDVSIQAQILNLMQDLQEERNLTYIFVTHNLSVVRHISTDIMVMYLGCTVEKTNAKELFAHQYHPYTKALISAIPHVNPDDSKKRILLKGELTSPINPKEACRFAPRCNYACDICHCQVPVLEEIEPGHFVACHLVREINGLK